MNTKQFATSALKFLARASLTGPERAEYDAVESALFGLKSGQLIMGAPQADPKPAIEARPEVTAE